MKRPDSMANPPGNDGTSLGTGAIEAYTKALHQGRAGRPEVWYREWLADDSASDPAEVAKLRTLDLLALYRTSLRQLWHSPGSDDPTVVRPPVEDLTPPEWSDPSATVAQPALPILDDEDWLKTNQLIKIGYLDARQGGMGEITLAWHTGMEKQVILKLALNKEYELRFRREIRIHAKIDGGPNILRSRSPLEYEESLVLVVDYVKGLDLKRWVKLNGPMKWEASCDCIKQAAQGLGHAHTLGVIHRDVKSSNLLRAEPDGRIIVIDWGLAFEHDRNDSDHGLTETGQGLGTPAYLSPEQARDARLATPASDLYGLGCVWFELLTGKPPFDDIPKGQLREAHAHADVPRLPENLGVPEPVEKILRKLLAKEPERRFFSAQALIDAIDQTLQPKVSPDPVRPGIDRRKLLAAAVGLPVAGGLGWLGWKLVEPIHVTRFEVRLTDPSGSRGVRKVLGKEVFDAQEQDELRIDAELSWPAYTYLIAFSPDGQMKICDPVAENLEPIRTKSPSYPPPNQSGDAYTLNEGPGLQAFALVWSKNPLKPFETWRNEPRDCPWKESRTTKEDMVWWFEGETLELLRPKQGGSRGTGQSKSDEGKVRDLKQWLKKQPGIDGVFVMAFSVLPPTK